MAQKRFAVVGLGDRSEMYTAALYGDFKAYGQLVAFCDSNQTRMDYYNREFERRFSAVPLPTYLPRQFDQMIQELAVETVIVTSADFTHHHYIIRAMELGCDVITEKPMTIDAAKCQAILATQRTTGRKLTVAFNYRYAPMNSQVKELLQAGAIGQITSVHFEWLLDTRHGADYFRRWHREKDKSGGLMVHKATHHFDLLNWWLDTRPETVFGFGKLAFYGAENARRRGESHDYVRSTGDPAAQNDPFALDLTGNSKLEELYLKAEKDDGYLRDRNPFASDITIEDDMALAIRYQNGATLTYHLTAYSPWEGFQAMFNGTQGRLEVRLEEASFAPTSKLVEIAEIAGEIIERDNLSEIVWRPQWARPRRVPVATGEGGHGGGDARLLHDIFVGAEADPLGRAANHYDGAWSVLTGIAANQAFATGLPVSVADLLPSDYLTPPPIL